jgi:hypothetical protein
MATRPVETRGRRHLASGIQSTVLSSAAAGVGSVIRIPLTIAAIGVAGYGALSTICALFGWVWFIAAGARNAGGAVAVSADLEHADATAVARTVARETFRHSALVVGLLALLALVLPWHTLVDPDHTMTRTALEVALFASIAIGLASVPGAALLGVYTTRGRFRDQNVAVVVGVCITTALACAGFALGAGPALFTMIWVAALAVPALPTAIWILKARRQPGHPTTTDIGSISRSGLWIAAGQQFASGFDLVIISVILGSKEAAAYGLVSRLAQLTLTAALGAVPVLTRSAGRARATALPSARKVARSLTLLVAGMQCAGLLVFVVLGGWACRLLSGGLISPPTALLMTAAGWGVVETVRLTLMSASATAPGLRHWRRSNLRFAVPNLALSVILTRYVGVSGPMLGSLIAVGAMVTLAGWSLRDDLREALGR